MSSARFPLGGMGRGLAAGLAGTSAMTAWQELAAKLQRSGHGGSNSEEEASGSGARSATQKDPWEQAPAPAQVARLILKSLLGIEVGTDKIGLLTNVSHWGYGTSWGVVYGLVRRGRDRRTPFRRGLGFGCAVWALSYAELVPLGIYEPPWKYAPRELALDLSYHLVYGAGVGLGYAALS